MKKNYAYPRTMKARHYLLMLGFLFLFSSTNLWAQTVSVHLTRGDQSALIQPQPNTSFSDPEVANATIEIDEQTTFQTIDGFGFALTQGSAEVLNTLNPSVQNTVLEEFFNPNSGTAVSVIRISIGASDLSNSVYYYNETPGDVNMNNFSLDGPDRTHLIPIIQKILAINPDIKILATPWSAPPWMKTNNASIGGSLQPQFYAAYARYFVRYLEEMNNEGIPIWGITPQNEPENPFNEPSMLMNASEQLDFINNHLGPAIDSTPFSPRIIAFDHNCDNPGYPISVLNNSPYAEGAAFHLYAGDISAMSTVHDQTGKNVYFTEQFTSSNGEFDGDLGFHLENVVIGSLRNWSKAVIEWNLAADPESNPRTPGGCSECLGAITVNNSNSFTKNVSYYIISQISQFVKPDAIRLASTNGILNVALRNPDGEKVLLVYNRNSADQDITVNWNGRSFAYTMEGRSAVTFTWEGTATPLPPSVPTNLTAVTNDEEVALSWDNANRAASYTVRRATSPNGPFTNIQTGLTATSFTDTNVTNGTTYYYRVRAVNSVGTSGDSDQISAIPNIIIINAFSQIEAEDFNASQGTQVENTSDTGGGQNVGFIDTDDYLFFENVDFDNGAGSIEARVASDADFVGTMELRLGSITGSLIGTISFGNTGGYQSWVTRRTNISGATGLRDLYLVFQGGDGIGNVNWIRFNRNSLGEVPARPTNLSATAGNAQVALSWNAAARANSYSVARSNSQNSNFSTLVSGLTTTSYTDTGLTNGTTYFYRVNGQNVAGSSPNSATVSAIPTVGPVSAFTQIEAEDYDNNQGLRTENTTDTGGGLNVGFADTNDYLLFNNIDFGNGAGSVDARIASNANFTGDIEFRLGSPNGTVIATVPVGNTGGWQSWTTRTANVSSASGIRNLYVVFKGGNGVGNINWFRFSTDSGNTGGGDTGGEGPEDIVSGAVYTITNKQSDRVIDVSGVSNNNGARVHQWQNTNGNNQRWRVENVGNNEYRLTAIHSNKSLDVVDNSTSPLAEIQQYDYFGNDNQKWTIQETPDGYYRIISVRSSLALEVPSGQNSNGVRLRQNNLSNGDNQKWSFDLISTNSSVNVTSLFSEEAANATLNEMLIYPNPVLDKRFSIQHPPNMETDMKVSIFDLSGRMVHKTVLSASEHEVELGSGFTPGLYIVKMEYHNSITTKNIIVE